MVLIIFLNKRYDTKKEQQFYIKKKNTLGYRIVTFLIN